MAIPIPLLLSCIVADTDLRRNRPQVMSYTARIPPLQSEGDPCTERASTLPGGQRWRGPLGGSGSRRRLLPPLEALSAQGGGLDVPEDRCRGKLAGGVRHGRHEGPQHKSQKGEGGQQCEAGRERAPAAYGPSH